MTRQEIAKSLRELKESHPTFCNICGRGVFDEAIKELETEPTLRVSTKKGAIIASISPDSDYPGIDVSYVPNNVSCEEKVQIGDFAPRMVMEAPKKADTINIHVWGDITNEDPTYQVKIKEEEP